MDNCDGAGGCVYVPALGVCAIGVVCWSVDDKNSENDCLVCDPDMSAIDWIVADAQSCDDVVVCTYTDICDGDTCGGMLYVCDDGSFCMVDECDGVGECTYFFVFVGVVCDD